MKSFINFLPPWVETNIQPAFYDKESGTCLQQTARMYAKVNQLVRIANEQYRKIEEYIAKFIELKDFVDTYFDNLDVQEEINNKLDEMAESGELADILVNQVHVKATYKTTADLIADTKLTANYLVEVLGDETLNDGRNFIYRISEEAPESLPIETNNEALDNHYLTLDNGLYAIPVNNLNNDYYDEITVETATYNNTTCYITTIPYHDDNDKEIDLYVKNNSGMEISDYAQKHKTTLSINATLAVLNPDTGTYDNASVISDGEIIRDFINPPEFLDDHYCFLGIKENRELADYQANNTTAEEMVADGVKQGFLTFGMFVKAGAITDYARGIGDNEEIALIPHPRQCLGQKYDKTIIILTCDGRTTADKGLTAIEASNILINLGCVNVWNLDGGGSTNTIYKGRRINKYIDGHGTQERHIVYCLNVKKPTANEGVDQTNCEIGKAKQEIIKQILPSVPRMEVKNPANLDDLTTGLHFYSCYNSTNYPSNAQNYGYLLIMPVASEQNKLYGTYCKQIYFSRTTNQMWIRTYNNEVWGAWKEINKLYCGGIPTTNDQTLGIGTNYPTISLGSVETYMPNTLTITDNKIYSSVPCACLIQARFTTTCDMDGLCSIRIRKNGTTVLDLAEQSMVSGNTYNICVDRLMTLNEGDYIEFQSNAGTNTGGVNKLKRGYITITQNFQ